MGCCCFNTLRGAAFFVASVHIYNGLECMLKFIAFPMVFTSMHDKNSETSFAAFLPGMGYAILYFLLGCIIFRGIETEKIPGIKWGAIGFMVVEVIFFILRVVMQIIPTPKVPELAQADQPFEMNIYKTLNYFLFTIVGGLVYLCILFLYIQKLSTGQDEFAQFFNITNRGGSTPTAAPAAVADPVANTANALSSGGGGSAQQNPASRSSSNNNNKPKSHHHHHHHKSTSDDQGGSRKPRLAANLNVNTPVNSVLSKEPQSPGSPMFPYFLLRRNSKLASSSKSDQPPPQQPQQQQQPMNQMDEPSWHIQQQQSNRNVQSVSVMRDHHNRDFDSPRSDIVSGGGRLLSPSRLVNHHQQPPLPPPHQFQPIIPPFYTDSADDSNNRSFHNIVPQGFQSPTNSSHYNQPTYSTRGCGGNVESLYSKIPMSSPGFIPGDYCLR